MVMLEIFNFLHFIGLAFGLGGATIANIISAKSAEDKEIASVTHKIMPPIIKLIWLGLILLIISGIALPFFIKWPINKHLLIIKHVLVVWIIIFGISLGLLSKKMKNLAPKPNKKPSESFLKSRKQMIFLGIINLILWYVVTILSAFV